MYEKLLETNFDRIIVCIFSIEILEKIKVTTFQ